MIPLFSWPSWLHYSRGYWSWIIIILWKLVTLCLRQIDPRHFRVLIEDNALVVLNDVYERKAVWINKRLGMWALSCFHCSFIFLNSFFSLFFLSHYFCDQPHHQPCFTVCALQGRIFLHNWTSGICASVWKYTFVLVFSGPRIQKADLHKSTWFIIVSVTAGFPDPVQQAQIISAPPPGFIWGSPNIPLSVMIKHLQSKENLFPRYSFRTEGTFLLLWCHKHKHAMCLQRCRLHDVFILFLSFFTSLSIEQSNELECLCSEDGEVRIVWRRPYDPSQMQEPEQVASLRSWLMFFLLGMMQTHTRVLRKTLDGSCTFYKRSQTS